MLALLAAGCEAPATDSGPYPDRERETLYRYGRLGGAEGLLRFDFGGFERPATPADTTVNRFLWLAALDTIAFMPITSADPKSGVILTDWYAEPGHSTERFKVDLYIRGVEFRPDNLQASVFRQLRAETAEWRDAPVPSGTADRLERAVLERARALKAAQPAESE